MPLNRRVSFVILGVLIVPIALFALYSVVTLSWAYSEGERAGYLQKFSKKGWLCKTWEGQMMTDGFIQKIVVDGNAEHVVRQLYRTDHRVV